MNKTGQPPTVLQIGRMGDCATKNSDLLLFGFWWYQINQINVGRRPIVHVDCSCNVTYEITSTSESSNGEDGNQKKGPPVICRVAPLCVTDIGFKFS